MKRKPLVPDALNPVRQLRVVGRLVRRQRKTPGTAPGTLVHTGPQHMERARITVIDYDPDALEEREVAVEDVAELFTFRDSPAVTWINIEGLHDTDLVRAVGDHFQVHPLTLEDIVHLGQRPKLEEYDGYLFMVLAMLTWSESDLVEAEQLSVLLGPRWVITFQERPGDAFDPVRERLRAASGRIRQRGPDYLAYALIDAVVDRYFTILEQVGEMTEELEAETLEDPTRETMENLHRLKREMLVVRRAVWPLREMTSAFMRTESPLLKEPTKVFVRDVYDHAVQVMDTVESLRDVVSGTMDLYLSHVGHRQNEIMKVLTVMASIFIPLTFVAGLYGMNFEYMPELGVPWAYPAVLALMVLMAAGMLAYFRRKGWI